MLITVTQPGKQDRFGLPNPPSKFAKFSNKLGHLFQALQQSPFTPTTTQNTLP